jgi:flagellar hook-associated protein 2
VSAGSTATEGTYNLVVSNLARAQVLASSSSYSSLDSEIATSGTLTITPAEGDPVEITVSASTTVSQLVAAINAATGGAASASAVQTTPGHYQLVLTGKNTGLANAFTVTSTLTGGEGLTFASGDGDGISGNDPTELVQTALNASFTVNGLAVESTTNVVTGVVPGATLTLRRQDPAETVSVTVGQDSEAAVSLVQSFLSAYNDIVQFIKDQDTAALAGKPSLSRDPLLRGFRNSFRSVLQGAYTEGDTFTMLAQVGVGFDRNGKLTLDKTVLNTALAASPGGVQALFSGTDGTGGVVGALTATLKDYTKAGGLVGLARDRLTSQVDGINTRLDALEARLAVRRAALQKEYLEADRLMSQLQAQGSSLAQLGIQFKSLGG